jgi:hypothetical protein
MISAGAAQGCAKLLVTKSCMMRVPHVRSTWPPQRPESQKPPLPDLQDDAHKQQRSYMISAGAAQGRAEMLVTKSCMIRVPHVRSARPP